MTDLKPDKPTDEKFDEKELEKQDEKQEEKSASWDEKWRRDPLSAVMWACILIWAGIVLLMETTNVLSTLKDNLNLEKLEAWPVILLGAGVVILLEVVVRLTVPAYRRSITGSLILAAVLIGVAINQITGKEVVWAIILIAIGAVMLLRGFSRK
jgi:hypothetical protein